MTSDLHDVFASDRGFAGGTRARMVGRENAPSRHVVVMA
jgi:hypothetical protein